MYLWACEARNLLNGLSVDRRRICSSREGSRKALASRGWN